MRASGKIKADVSVTATARDFPRDALARDAFGVEVSPDEAPFNEIEPETVAIARSPGVEKIALKLQGLRAPRPRGRTAWWPASPDCRRTPRVIARPRGEPGRFISGRWVGSLDDYRNTPPLVKQMRVLGVHYDIIRRFL